MKLILVAIALGALSCKKGAPTSTAAPKASAQKVSAAPAASPPPTAAAPPPIAKPKPVEHAEAVPVALDEAGQRRAKAYLAALGRGRKATVAKDYEAAEHEFSKALELSPKDPRALAERGYARLLAEKLKEAEQDLNLADSAAPNTTVKLQILHNLGLIAKKRGEEERAKYFEDERKRLKQARRLENGTTCELSTGSSQLEPERPVSLDDAFQSMREAHAAEDPAGSATEVTFGGSNNDGGISPEDLRALAAKGPLPEHAWTLTSYRGDLWIANHVLISHAGQLFVYPELSVGNAARCMTPGLADLRVGGGGTQPFHILRTLSSAEEGFMCEGANHQMGPCTADNFERDDPKMTFCGWSGTTSELTLLDAETLKGITSVKALAVPSAEAYNSLEPARLLDFDWQPDHVKVTACGETKRVPFAAD